SCILRALSILRRLPISPLFPSPTLFRSLRVSLPRLRVRSVDRRHVVRDAGGGDRSVARPVSDRRVPRAVRRRKPRSVDRTVSGTDRKSTRLNSSHGSISYAVFCLKKKKN